MCISQLIGYQGRQIFVNARAENLGWGSNAWLQICDILSADIFFFSHLPLSFNPLSPNIHIQILQTDLYIFP